VPRGSLNTSCGKVRKATLVEALLPEKVEGFAAVVEERMAELNKL
jgi:hypothetical protein